MFGASPVRATLVPGRPISPPLRLWKGSKMNGNEAAEPADDDILAFDVSDAALEAAASVPPGAALSFPNSPTVSILVMCCSDQGGA